MFGCTPAKFGHIDIVSGAGAVLLDNSFRAVKKM
jgi:hypothetical protein